MLRYSRKTGQGIGVDKYWLVLVISVQYDCAVEVVVCHVMLSASSAGDLLFRFYFVQFERYTDPFFFSRFNISFSCEIELFVETRICKLLVILRLLLLQCVMSSLICSSRRLP